MMQMYLHPDTNVPVMGTRLGAWAQIRKGDFYASTRGNWEPIPYEGMILEPGCEVTWVRAVDVSDEGKALLDHVVQSFRRTARISHSRASTELAELGLIAVSEPSKYEVTEAGSELFRLLCRGR